jgi:DNA polymerase I-like protein with 3'-5' exonuclease and polymerase domains
MSWEIVTSAERFQTIMTGWSGLIAVDTETYGARWDADKRLLGVSLAPEYSGNGLLGIYIPFNVFDKGEWYYQCHNPSLIKWPLAEFLAEKRLVGHNFTYDKWWVENGLGIESKTMWQVDTRIMWHLASAPTGPRPYGLKDAMVEVLGWGNTNDELLASEVKARGGNIRNGDHYLASLDTLAHYAILDAHATMQLYKHLKPFFDQHDYWSMLAQMMQYNLLLDNNTTQGILVDKEGLQKSHNRLLKTKEAAAKRFKRILKEEINDLEEAWADRRIAEYKREYNKIRYAAHPEEWRRFNLNSDKDKRELFYDKLQLEAFNRTPGGQPSVDGDSLKRHNHPFVAAYLKYEKANTLSTNFSGPYLHSVLNNRLHPGFNICGTVSYRLSGFKPYLLNAPFDEKAILRHLRCDPGYIGIHADLSAIEPTITAHYSEDSALLKVFRNGLGDIYLDLALEIFPNDKELKDGYNPNIPISKEVKRRFERQRKVAKVIQLAVQYTGTGHTVSRNLSKDGIPTTAEEADNYVRAYWKKFERVAQFNRKLFELNRQQGYLRNVIGRIIRVPFPDYKDLPNRFIQSSAHDVLVIWVLEISRLFEERGIKGQPILTDCHDSTSWQIPAERVGEAKAIYQEALDWMNRELGLCVTIRADIKTFQTLAGLKGAE